MRINYNGFVSINGKQGATNTALVVSDATNATLIFLFPSSGNIAFGGNQGHNLNFGNFSTKADTTFTSQITLNSTSGAVSCSGSLTSSGAIHANSGILTINAADWTSSGSKGVIFSLVGCEFGVFPRTRILADVASTSISQWDLVAIRFLLL